MQKIYELAEGNDSLLGLVVSYEQQRGFTEPFEVLLQLQVHNGVYQPFIGDALNLSFGGRSLAAGTGGGYGNRRPEYIAVLEGRTRSGDFGPFQPFSPFAPHVLLQHGLYLGSLFWRINDVQDCYGCGFLQLHVVVGIEIVYL